MYEQPFSAWRDVDTHTEYDNNDNLVEVAIPGDMHYAVNDVEVSEEIFNKLSVLQKVEMLLEHRPELRLGQILSNAAYLGGWEDKDIYYCPDTTLLKGLLILLTEVLEERNK